MLPDNSSFPIILRSQTGFSPPEQSSSGPAAVRSCGSLWLPLPAEPASPPCQQWPQQRAGTRTNLFIWCVYSCVTHWIKNMPQKYLSHRWGRGKPIPNQHSTNQRCCCGATSAPRMCCLKTQPCTETKPRDPPKQLDLHWKSCQVNIEHPSLGKCNTAITEQSWFWEKYLDVTAITAHRDTPLFPSHLIICI